MPAVGAVVVAAAPYIGAAAGAMSLIKSFSGSGGGSATAAAPALSSPTKLPTPEDTGKAAEKASLLQMQQRRGRASTILTGEAQTDKLGA